jgi:parvulin-like peptidyl-prolyl isomerase
MLKIMRERSRIVLWIVAIAFIVFTVAVWGMDLLSSEQNVAAAYIGEVDDAKISVSRYRDEINTLVQNYRRQNQENDPPEDLRRQLDEQAWQNLVQRAVIQKEIDRRGLRATDKEVLLFVRSNPLPMFTQNPSLQTNGQFDMAKYQQALNDPRIDWRWLEEYARSLLPVEKLRQEVAATVRVTDEEIREKFLSDQEQARVTYLAVSPRDFRDTTATFSDQELEAYYRAHPEEFKRKDQATAAYVLFEKIATAADEEEVKGRAEEILREAQGGADFAELARIYSEDTQTATQGGDLGFFGKGMMVPEFETPTFAAEPGAFVGPVKTKFGYHVIKVEERRTAESGETEVRARHVLLKIEPSQETIGALYERAEAFATRARSEGLDKAAKVEGLVPSETSPFPKGDFIPGLGMFQRANAFAFANDPGTTSAVLEGPRGLYVFSISERTPEGVPPFAEIKDAVLERARLDRQREAARARATEIANQIAAGRPLEEVGAAYGLEKRETPLFTRITTLGGIGRGTAFTHAAFALEPGQTSGPIQTNAGFFVLRVEERRPGNESEYATRKEMIRRTLHQEKVDARFQELVDELIARAAIKDRRGLQMES